jgi:hypothetical protein
MKTPYTASRGIQGFELFPNSAPQIMAQIKMLTGVVEVGLFCNMAKAAYFGNEVCALASFKYGVILTVCSRTVV